MSDHQAGTGPNPSPHNINVASGQTVRIQQVLAATPQNVNVLTSRGQQLYIASQVNVPGLTQVIPTIPSNNAGIQQGVARILNITPSSRVNVVGVPQVPGRTASVQLTNTGNNASGEVSGRGAMSLVAISQPSTINAASHPTLVSTLSSPPRQRTMNSIGIMQSSPTLVLTPSHTVRSPANPHSSPQSSTSGIPRKRIRLIEMQENPPPNEEIAMARKTILDHKTVQMSAVREQFAERTAELFFLQLGGNMMDYFSWRKRPPSAQFLHFLRTNPLDPDDDDEDLTQVLSKTLSAPSTSSSEAKSVVTSTVVPPVTASASQPPPSQLPQAAPVQKAKLPVTAICQLVNNIMPISKQSDYMASDSIFFSIRCVCISSP